MIANTLAQKFDPKKLKADRIKFGSKAEVLKLFFNDERCMDKVTLTNEDGSRAEKPKDAEFFTRFLFEQGDKVAERPGWAGTYYDGKNWKYNRMIDDELLVNPSSGIALSAPVDMSQPAIQAAAMEAKELPIPDMPPLPDVPELPPPAHLPHVHRGPVPDIKVLCIRQHR